MPAQFQKTMNAGRANATKNGTDFPAMTRSNFAICFSDFFFFNFRYVRGGRRVVCILLIRHTRNAG